MEFTTPRKSLHAALQTVTRAVSGKSTLPILSNIHCRATGDTVTFAATDLELGIKCSFPATVKNPGEITVPAKTIGDLVSQLGEGEVSLKTDDRNTAVLQLGRSTYKMLGLPAEDYPPLPEVSGEVSFSVTQADLSRMIRSVSVATADDKTRPLLTGVLTSLSNDKLIFAATDTHRLAVRSCAVTEAVGERSVIIPVSALQEVLRVLEPNSTLLVQVRLDANQVSFDTGSVQLVARLLEGTFPKYGRIIPAGHKTRLTATTADLLIATKRAAIVAREGGLRLQLRTEGSTLTLTAQAGTVGNAEEELEVTCDGEPLDCALNYHFLQDILGVMDTEQVVMETEGRVNSALVVKPLDDDSFFSLVMPLATV